VVGIQEGIQEGRREGVKEGRNVIDEVVWIRN
jgi:hypothetical protein